MEIIPNENLPKMAECEPAIVKVQPGKVYSWCTCGFGDGGLCFVLRCFGNVVRLSREYFEEGESVL